MESQPIVQATLDALPDHVSILDQAGNILFVNAAWRDFADANQFGDPNYGLGTNYLQVCDSATGDSSQVAKEAAAGIRLVISGELETFSFDYPCHAPSEKRWFKMRATRIGCVEKPGAIIIHENISERKQIEASLIERDIKYHALFEGAADAIFLMLGNYFIDCNLNMLRMFACTREQIINQSLHRFSPPDQPDGISSRDKALNYIQAALDNIPQHFEWTYIQYDGTPFEAEVRLTRVDLGQEPHLLASIQNISERKRIENDLHIKDNAIASAINAVAIADLNGNLSYVNAAFLSMWGYQNEAQVLGRSITDFWVDPGKAANLLATLEKQSSWVNELLGSKKNGSPFDVQLSASLVHNEQGIPISMMASFIDISERKRAERELKRANTNLETRLAEIEALRTQLQEQAIRDSLTGLYNRRYLEENLTQAIARADRFNYPLSLVMIDIDHFKVVNDTYGHKAGDEMLIALGNLLQDQIRKMDTICRYGGEEFVVLMPRASWESAHYRANQWRIAFQNLHVPYEGTLLNATLSAGIATLSPEDNDIEDAMREADIAMYRSKSEGRNRITVSKKYRA